MLTVSQLPPQGWTSSLAQHCREFPTFEAASIGMLATNKLNSRYEVLYINQKVQININQQTIWQYWNNIGILLETLKGIGPISKGLWDIPSLSSNSGATSVVTWKGNGASSTDGSNEWIGDEVKIEMHQSRRPVNTSKRTIWNIMK